MTEPTKPTTWYFEQGEAPRASDMTLRDWFAGQTLNGVLADPECTTSNDHNRERLATFCYQMADAMMKARGEG